MPNSKSGNPILRLLGLLLYIPAAILMPFWETGKFLSKKAYSGGGFIRGLFVGLSGVPATIYGAFFAANVVGWHYHLAWPVWTIAGALGAALVSGIVWPAFYLAILKPLWDLGDKLFKLNEKFAKNVVQPLSTGLVGVARHLPGADHLWEVSQGKTKSGRKWGIEVLGFLLGLGFLFVGLAAGYGVYHLCLNAIGIFGALPLLTGIFASQVLAASLGITVLVFVTGFFWQYLATNDGEKGSQSFTGIGWASVITYLAATKVAAIAGLSLAAFVPAVAAVFVISLAYVVPGVLALLQGGLVDRILKGWGKLLDAAYDADKDKDYALFFAQVANIAIALGEAAIAFFVAGAVHLPAAIVYAVTALVGLWSYASNPKELGNTREVSPIFGVVLSLAAGIGSWYFAPAGLIAHGLLRFLFGAGMTAFVGFLAYPIAYLALRLVTKPVSAPAGKALEALSKKATAAYKTISDKVRKLQKAAFDDSTPYAGMFGHLFIIGVIVAAIFHGLPTTLPLVHFGFWINTALTIIAAINVYMLLAKLSSSFGAETLSATTGGIALLVTGHWALGVSGGSYWAAGVVGLASAFIVGGLLAPAAYLLVRVPANAILTPWLAPIIKTVYDFLWKVYAGFWSKFSVVFHILKAVLGPLFGLIASIWAGVQAAYARMFGRRS